MMWKVQLFLNIFLLSYNHVPIEGSTVLQSLEEKVELKVDSEKVTYNATAAKQWYWNRCFANSQRLICTIGSQINKICGFSSPFNIEITDNGRVFVTEYGTKYVHILNLVGNRIKKFSIPKGNPTGLFVKGSIVYVTNHIDEVYKYTLDGEFLGMKYIKKASTVSVALDYDDLMYVTQWNSRNIQVFHRDGTKSHVISYSGMYPRILYFNGKNNLYVSDHYSKRIYVFNKSGSLLRKIPIPTAALIDGFIVDRNGNLYVPDRTKNAGKLVITNNVGQVLKTIGGMVGASDVDIAPDGTIWVVDFEGNCLLHF